MLYNISINYLKIFQSLIMSFVMFHLICNIFIFMKYSDLLVTKEDTAKLRQAERDLINSFKNRRTQLEDRLYEKVQQLKLICLKESVC